MKVLLLLTSLFLTANSLLLQPEPLNSTDSQTDIDTDTDTRDQDEDQLFCIDETFSNRLEKAFALAEVLPEDLSREKAIKVLQRALDIAKRQPSGTGRSSCNSPSLDQEAKGVLRYMTGDPNIGSSSENSQQASQNLPSESESCEEPRRVDKYQFSLKVMKDIVSMKDRGCSIRTIKARYNRYRPQYLERFRQAIASGGSRASRRSQIDRFVYSRFIDARFKKLPVHEYQLKRWALEKAGHLDDEGFRASDHWVHQFKKRNNIVSRKVTELGNRAMNDQRDQIRRGRQRFLDDYASIRHLFRPHLIWNTDQSGFRYELSNERTLSLKGERDTTLDVDSQNKNRHSYTIQPTVSRDGRLVGKLLICLKENGEKFGPIVEKEVRKLERELGNVHVVCSKSGKMSSRLIDDWVEQVLQPALERSMLPCDGETDIDSSSDTELMSQESSNSTIIDCSITEPSPGPSWASKPGETLSKEQKAILRMRSESSSYLARPDLLLLADSWGGHSSRNASTKLAERRIQLLQIPKHTTMDLQPLDVNFFRQYKKFVKRISEEALHNNMVREVTSRLGIINMHSIVFNQLGSNRYNEMIRYGWRNTDPNYGDDMIDPEALPSMVQTIQFDIDPKKTCEVQNCSSEAFIKCSHCGKHLCLRHFLERICFHEADDSGDIYDVSDTCSLGHNRQFPTSTTERSRDAASTSSPSSNHDEGAILTGGVAAIAGKGAITAGAIGAGGAAILSTGSSSLAKSKQKETIELNVELNLEEVKGGETIVTQNPKVWQDLIRD